MFITGLGTASPTQRYTQKECWEVFRQSTLSQQLSPRSRAIVKKVLTGEQRHHHAPPRAGQSQSGVRSHARCAARAVRSACAPARHTGRGDAHWRTQAAQPDQIDALLISTCTGYLCPGLTSYVSERLGLRPDVLGLDLVGQGCAAALPNLRAGEALLAAGRVQRVLSICVEVCSAALYFDDDPGVLISACLFGDGAGAAVLAHAPNGQRRVEWKTSTAFLSPQSRGALRFEQKAGMLRNVLLQQVPALAAQYAGTVLDDVLAKTRLGRSQVKGWVLAPRWTRRAGCHTPGIGPGQRGCALERGCVAGVWQREQRVRVLRSAGGAERLHARRILVDVILRSRLQLPRGAAGSGVKGEAWLPDALNQSCWTNCHPMIRAR